MQKDLDLAIIRFMKSCTSGVEEMLALQAEEYRLRFGRPLLIDSTLRSMNCLDLIHALEQAIQDGNPNITAVYNQQRKQAMG